MKPKAIDTARACWPVLPDWIDALAHECDKPKQSQRKVGAQLSCSGTTVNLLLKNKYAPRDHSSMEVKVRAQFMVTILICPVLGIIDWAKCLKEQTQPLVTCNPVSVQLYRACRDGCHFYEKKEQ